MARSTRVSPPRSKKSSPSVNHRPPHRQIALSPRRSSRLRSSPPRPNATRPTATSVPRAAATTEATGPGLVHDSHHPSTEHRASVKEQIQEQELQLDPVPLPALSGKGALARRSATSLEPNAVAPRSPNKRRRGLDHYDLVPVPSSGSDVNNELTTPRALRALKRQRLHLDPQQAPLPPKPSPSGPRHHRPRSPSPSSGEAQSICPELPPEVPDNDLSAVGPDATAPATHEQNDAAFGDNEAAREQSGSGLPLSATDSLPSVPVPAVEESNAAASDGVVVVAEPSGAESPSIGAVTDLAAPSGPAAFVSADRSPSPAPASNDAVPPSLGASATPPALRFQQGEHLVEAPEQAPAPAPVAQDAPRLSEPMLEPLIPLALLLASPEEQWAYIAAERGLCEDAVITMSLNRWQEAVRKAGEKAGRGERPKNQKAEAWSGTWKHEMMVRVEAVMEWATREIVHAYNQLQGREECMDFCNFSPESFPADVEEMTIDAEADETFAEEVSEDDDDSDDDYEDDEDFDIPDISNVTMEVDSIEPAPEFVEGCSSSGTAASGVSEEPNRPFEPPLPRPPTPPPSIPPRFRNLTPKLPGLFSFHTGPFEQPYQTPDGLPYLGRGTPVDKQRRNDWANIRPAPPPPPPRYTPSEESWFSSLVTTPSILSGNPSSITSDPNANFGVPTEVGPFCCTQDGLYGAGGPMLTPDYHPAGPSAGASAATSVSASAFDYPAPQAWTGSLHGPDAFPPLPPDLAGSFAAPGTAPAADPLPPATQVTTGCMFHSSLLECLTSGLGCVSGPFAGMPMSLPMSLPMLPPPPPSPPLVPCTLEAANPPGGPVGMDGGPYDVAMDPVPVQASSALSHALG